MNKWREINTISYLIQLVGQVLRPYLLLSSTVAKYQYTPALPRVTEEQKGLNIVRQEAIIDQILVTVYRR